MTEPRDRSRTARTHWRGSLNDYLASPECQRDLDPWYAGVMLKLLQRRDVVIWEVQELIEFDTAHPEYFCDLTDEELAPGRGLGFRVLWRQYERWRWNWDAERQETILRSLADQR